MPVLSPQAIVRGNPASDTHEPNPQELVAWMEAQEGSTNPVLYGARTAEAAEAMVARMVDGQVGFMAGLAYTKQSSIPLAASVTEDLGVAGLNYAGVLSVGHVGANGSAGETAKFQRAIDMLPANGGVIELQDGVDYTVTIGSLNAGSKRILWVGSDVTINGNEVWTLPGTQESYAVNGALGRQIYNVENGQAGDGTYKDNRRNAGYTGGAGGVLDFIERWETTIGAGVGSSGNRKAEKVGAFVITNNSDFANGVAVQLQTYARAQGAVWGLEVSTWSEVVPASFAHRGAEFAISAAGADANSLRWITDIVSHSLDQDTYAGDSIHVGANINAGSADMEFGVRVYDHLSGAKGKITQAAYYADTEGDLARLYGRGVSGQVKIGSTLDTNNAIVASISGQGRNAAAELTTYTQMRSVISSRVNGAEDGALQLYAMVGGTLERQVSFLEGRIDPGADGVTALGSSSARFGGAFLADLNLLGIPTSDAGLSSGDVWNDANTLKIVP